MILLEYSNRILEEAVATRLDKEAVRANVDIVAADFDGVTYHISTPEGKKNLLNISMAIKCAAELRKYGADDLLKAQYGNLIVASETGYDVTLQINLDSPPADKAIVSKIGMLKRHILAAPFKHVFEGLEGKGNLPPIIELRYRDEEAMFIKPEGDRCIVIFSICFKDADDIVIGKVFLQEFADARRSMTNVPAVTFSQKDPPLELKGVRGVKPSDNTGFVSFVLFQQHMGDKQREKTINLIQTFRNYFHYHIKCSKGYLHTRMRNRVESLLQILNRARPEPLTTVARTITGKTFTRKV